MCVWFGQAFLRRTARQCRVLFCTAGSPLLHAPPARGRRLWNKGVNPPATVQRVKQGVLDTIAPCVKLIASFSSLHFVAGSIADWCQGYWCVLVESFV